MLMMQRLTAGWPIVAAAAAQGVTPKTMRKWRDRYHADGVRLDDRSSRPRHSPTRLANETHDAMEQLRRQRLSGPAIARRLGLRVSTVGVGCAASAVCQPCGRRRSSATNGNGRAK
jgi:transposase-like protein